MVYCNRQAVAVIDYDQQSVEVMYHDRHKSFPHRLCDVVNGEHIDLSIPQHNLGGNVSEEDISTSVRACQKTTQPQCERVSRRQHKLSASVSAENNSTSVRACQQKTTVPQCECVSRRQQYFSASESAEEVLSVRACQEKTTVPQCEHVSRRHQYFSESVSGEYTSASVRACQQKTTVVRHHFHKKY